METVVSYGTNSTVCAGVSCYKASEVDEDLESSCYTGLYDTSGGSCIICHGQVADIHFSRSENAEALDISQVTEWVRHCSKHAAWVDVYVFGVDCCSVCLFVEDHSYEE